MACNLRRVRLRYWDGRQRESSARWRCFGRRTHETVYGGGHNGMVGSSYDFMTSFIIRTTLLMADLLGSYIYI